MKLLIKCLPNDANKICFTFMAFRKNVKLLLLSGIVSGMSIVDLVNDAICLL